MDDPSETPTIKVLYCGDGEHVQGIVSKNTNYYLLGEFVDESQFLIKALRDTDPPGRIEVTHLHNYQCPADFPRRLKGRYGLANYDVVVISDCPAESILFYPQLQMQQAPVGPNRLKLLREWVDCGGGLLMIGGWSSFAGYAGGARYGKYPFLPLPVEVSLLDDRQEVVEGIKWDPESVVDHPVTRGLPWEKRPTFVGYNDVKPKEGAQTLVKFANGDPLLVIGTHGRGRTMAFASDCAPHWAGSFTRWKGYSRFWVQAVEWLAGHA
ncbi:MAG: glutamine amidotransferase [Promethearchaeota archaeon]